MRYLLPVLFVMFVAAPAAHAQGINDFANFSRAIGKEVSIADQKGLTRQGIVEAVTADDVTLRFGSATQSFRRAEIASAERMKDGRRDGALKGAIFGVITGAWAMRAYQRHPEWLSPSANRTGMFFLHVSSWSGLGWLVDAANTNREPFYRAPAADPMGTLQLSFRF